MGKVTPMKKRKKKKKSTSKVLLHITVERKNGANDVFSNIELIEVIDRLLIIHTGPNYKKTCYPFSSFDRYHIAPQEK